MLRQLHEGHLGIQRYQNLAKDSIYWPYINNDIYNIVSACETCVKYRNMNPREMALNHEIVYIPWYKIGPDLCEFDRKYYLLVVDYFSKYIEVEPLSTAFSSLFVIDKFKSIFSRHGVPTILISDNSVFFPTRD